MKMSAVAYWLLPTEPARESFTELIGQLAARFNAPVFEPHLTVFVAPDDSSSPADIVRELGDVRLSLTSTGIRCSEQFTKTLFVQFRKTQRLQRLADAIWKSSGARERYVVDPHLSLLYKYLPKKTKHESANSIQLPFGEVIFDSVCAMHCVSPTQNADDVRAWELVASQNSKRR